MDWVGLRVWKEGEPLTRLTTDPALPPPAASTSQDDLFQSPSKIPPPPSKPSSALPPDDQLAEALVKLRRSGIDIQEAMKNTGLASKTAPSLPALAQPKMPSQEPMESPPKKEAPEKRQSRPEPVRAQRSPLPGSDSPANSHHSGFRLPITAPASQAPALATFQESGSLSAS